MELNIIIDNGNLVGDEQALFFHGEPVQQFHWPLDMFDLLVFMGAFKSKSEARKNWKQTGAQIPKGFTDLKRIGRDRHRLTILNPTPANK